MKIRAALSEKPDSPFSIEEVVLDDPRPDEVLVKVVASGLCHTDLMVKGTWEGDAGPIVLGHEGAGVVEAVGSEVSTVAVGDHVVLSYRSCGSCRPCRRGTRAYCLSNFPLNFSGARLDGSTRMRQADRAVYGSFFGQSSFATHALAYEDNLVVVDPAVDLTVAAPMGCGFQTGAGAVLNVLRPAEGSAVAVFGVGGVGMAAIMAAATLGPEHTIAIDPVPERRATALRLGATAALDPTDGEVAAQLADLTGGGVDAALDTTGKPAVFTEALRSLAPLGTLATVSSAEPVLDVDMLGLIVGGRTLRGIIEGDANPQEFVPRLLELHAAGRFPVEEIIGTYPFDAIDDAVLDSSSGAVVKPVLVMP